MLTPAGAVSRTLLASAGHLELCYRPTVVSMKSLMDPKRVGTLHSTNRNFARKILEYFELVFAKPKILGYFDAFRCWQNYSDGLQENFCEA